MPAVERHLFCDHVSGDATIFTHCHSFSRSDSAWYVDLLRQVIDALDVLPKRLLYLDSDTYLIEEIPDLFGMLDRFDFAAAHAPGRSTAHSVCAIPDTFPEVNIGVIAMRNNEPVRRLWQDTSRRLSECFATYGNNDQAPLREALWNNSEVRLAILPPEYNCRFRFGTFVRGRVKILHGRGQYRKVAASINSRTGMRTWPY